MYLYTLTIFGPKFSIQGFFFSSFTTQFIGQYMAKFSAKKHILCDKRYQKFNFRDFLKSFVQALAILTYEKKNLGFLFSDKICQKYRNYREVIISEVQMEKLLSTAEY